MNDAANNLALSAVVSQNLDGQNLANFYLHDVRRGIAPPDALCDRIRLLVATGDAERLRSFCRVVQKTLERAAFVKD